jgi:hypothetical protein
MATGDRGADAVSRHAGEGQVSVSALDPGLRPDDNSNRIREYL